MREGSHDAWWHREGGTTLSVPQVSVLGLPRRLPCERPGGTLTSARPASNDPRMTRRGAARPGPDQGYEQGYDPRRQPGRGRPPQDQAYPPDPGHDPRSAPDRRRQPDRAYPPDPGHDRRQPDPRYQPDPGYGRRGPAPGRDPGYDEGYGDAGYTDPGYDPGYDRGYDNGYRQAPAPGYDRGYGQPQEPGYGTPEPGYGDPRDPRSRGGRRSPEREPEPEAPRKQPRPKADPADKGPKLPHLPALDGLRALALLAVLANASGLEAAGGGYLGISSVFTLSGFLLATLALAEWSQSSTLQLRRFWDRRARRLLPSYLVVLLIIVALQAVVRVGSVPTFRTDLYYSLGFAENWRLAFPAEGFTRSFNELSSLRHLWPVAVTAQVYLVFPLVFVLLMLVTGRRWRTAGVLFGIIALASFGAAWRIGGNPDAREIAYYGTHTRVGELLVGVVLAYLVLTPGFRAFLSRPTAMRVLRNGGVAALVAILALWLLVPIDSPWLFHGVTALNAVLTAWVVLAVTMPGPAASLLAFSPLRHLGEISFAAYLLHWPIYLLLDEDRTGLDGPLLFAARLGATLVAGLAFWFIVEQPFRNQVRVARGQLVTAFAATAAIVVALAVVLPVNPPANISLTVDDGNGPGDLEVVMPAGGSPAAKVLVIGDQAAGSMVGGFEAWNQLSVDQQLQVDTHVTPDCPLGGPGERESFGQQVEPTIDCEAWRFRLPKMLDASDPDVIVVVMGLADLGSRKIDRKWVHLGDGAYDRFMADQIDGLADVLAETGKPVLWATYPHQRIEPDPDDPSSAWSDFDDNDPRRVDVLNELIYTHAGYRKNFSVVDFDAWLNDQPRGQFDPEMRTGAELTEPGATAAVGWLAPQIVSAAG
jgi:peptidoglycan/LPS O-acetylase OafA/YrhL